MTIRLGLVLFFLVFGGTALADAPKAKGFYLGVSAGASVFDDDGAIGVFDDTDSTIQAYLGYKFFKHLSIHKDLF